MREVPQIAFGIGFQLRLGKPLILTAVEQPLGKRRGLRQPIVDIRAASVPASTGGKRTMEAIKESIPTIAAKPRAVVRQITVILDPCRIVRIELHEGVRTDCVTQRAETKGFPQNRDWSLKH